MSLTVAADRRLGWCHNAPVTSFCSEELFVNYIKFCSFLVRPGRAAAAAPVCGGTLRLTGRLRLPGHSG